eukprot:TRINITY_DN7317_c0_g1_i1.p1 TRINITY_DN7317_c0_g1~~TRINITY_DN7317_c0_g1_i1.p1  ORF type:complete len:456 (-),score=110.38 TRINITY_DN7317_c0_g1_i1:871-2238(-)
MDPISFVNQTKENLHQGIESLKKAEGDFSQIIKAASNHRQQLLELHEAGKKLAVEMRKIGENRPGTKRSPWATEFANRAKDQEQLENLRFEMQTKFWDQFILPLMTASEKDSKELQATEKKLKNVSQSIQHDIKKKKSELKASVPTITNETEGIKELIAKHDEVSLYFNIYKQRQFHRWLKPVCAAFDAQRDYYGSCVTLLKGEPWKIVLGVQHPPLPELGMSGLGADQQVNSYPAPYSGAVRSGYLVKRGAKMKNWKRRFFVVTPDTIYYFADEPSVRANREPLGSISLSTCSSCVVNNSMKKDYCFELTTPTRIYYCSCVSKDEMDLWMSTLSLYIYSSVSTPYLLDAVQEGGSDSNRQSADSIRSAANPDSPRSDLNQSMGSTISAPLPPPIMLPPVEYDVRPDDPEASAEPQPELAEGAEEPEWKEFFDQTEQRPYYFNSRTQETRWESPF